MLARIVIIVLTVGSEMVKVSRKSGLLEDILARTNFCCWSVKLKFVSE